MFYQNKKQETTEIGGDGYTLPEGRATHQRYRTFKTSAEQQYIDTAVIIMESKKVPNGKTFNMRDPEIRQKTIDIIDFLFSIQDVDAMVEVASILKQGLTAEQYNYVLGMVLVHREDARGYLPPWPEVLPSYFLRREVIQKLNASSAPGEADYIYFDSGCGCENFENSELPFLCRTNGKEKEGKRAERIEGERETER
ncbi:hypothetical protein AAG570_014074 [Ranatra chinensis]|uniref:Hemocyanin N-terminal domain-containing protein n=1 Tax=Ranatra chinensis TaxID=642074 RepID=A0ABD0XU13_9HEMI